MAETCARSCPLLKNVDTIFILWNTLTTVRETVYLGSTCRLLRQIFVKECFPAEARLLRVQQNLVGRNCGVVKSYLRNANPFIVAHALFRFPGLFLDVRFAGLSVWKEVLRAVRFKAGLCRLQPVASFTTPFPFAADVDWNRTWLDSIPILTLPISGALRIYTSQMDRATMRDYIDRIKPSVQSTPSTSVFPFYMDWILGPIRLNETQILCSQLYLLTVWLFFDNNIPNLPRTPYHSNHMPPHGRSVLMEYLVPRGWQTADPQYVRINHSNVLCVMQHLQKSLPTLDPSHRLFQPFMHVLSHALIIGDTLAFTLVDFTTTIPQHPSTSDMIFPLLVVPTHWVPEDKRRWAKMLYQHGALVDGIAKMGKWITVRDEKGWETKGQYKTDMTVNHLLEFDGLLDDETFLMRDADLHKIVRKETGYEFRNELIDIVVEFWRIRRGMGLMDCLGMVRDPPDDFWLCVLGQTWGGMTDGEWKDAVNWVFGLGTPEGDGKDTIRRAVLDSRMRGSLADLSGLRFSGVPAGVDGRDEGSEAAETGDVDDDFMFEDDGGYEEYDDDDEIDDDDNVP
ncbi:hypothetical protein HK097_007578 [Rhizophlyctis rosea]|uniref:Uncharacterized protein n=1 Tax=Rhizophlyctis rosea TaxID=64517 RepID=A0AAD5XAE3_9FUNG|nr:hypothetical protein HK097_007578 [Rhizophlyctis rosea]